MPNDHRVNFGPKRRVSYSSLNSVEDLTKWCSYVIFVVLQHLVEERVSIGSIYFNDSTYKTCEIELRLPDIFVITRRYGLLRRYVSTLTTPQTGDNQGRKDYFFNARPTKTGGPALV
jgi:hypothetical protein